MNFKEIVKKYFMVIFDHRPVNIVKPQIAVLSQSELLKGRCALITGGSSGIGYAIAKAFLNAGSSVVITGRNENRLHTAIKNLEHEGSVFYFAMDNKKVDKLEHSLIEIVEMIKRNGLKNIDILVNNAGVNSVGMPKASEEEYDNVMDTNLKGVYFLSQIFATYLIKNNIQGNILNIASASCLRPANSPYILSKWGVRSLTMGMAKSLEKYGITVNGIAPGPTLTPMMHISEDGNIALNRLPLGRYVLPEEIANMAVVLTSDMGKSIIGDIVMMTGGAGNITFDDVPYDFEIN